jgi:hypothetical protein
MRAVGLSGRMTLLAQAIGREYQQRLRLLRVVDGVTVQTAHAFADMRLVCADFVTSAAALADLFLGHVRIGHDLVSVPIVVNMILSRAMTCLAPVLIGAGVVKQSLMSGFLKRGVKLVVTSLAGFGTRIARLASGSIVLFLRVGRRGPWQQTEKKRSEQRRPQESIQHLDTETSADQFADVAISVDVLHADTSRAAKANRSDTVVCNMQVLAQQVNHVQARLAVLTKKIHQILALYDCHSRIVEHLCSDFIRTVGETGAQAQHFAGHCDSKRQSFACVRRNGQPGAAFAQQEYSSRRIILAEQYCASRMARHRLDQVERLQRAGRKIAEKAIHPLGAIDTSGFNSALHVVFLCRSEG